MYVDRNVCVSAYVYQYMMRIYTLAVRFLCTCVSGSEQRVHYTVSWRNRLVSCGNKSVVNNSHMFPYMEVHNCGYHIWKYTSVVPIYGSTHWRSGQPTGVGFQCSA